MTILILSSHTPSLFWFRLEMMKSFIQLGHEVVAAGPDNESLWKCKFSEQSIRYVQIAVSRNGMNPFNDLRTLLCLNQLLKSEKPSKIFVYQAKTIAYGCIAARWNGIKEVYPMVAGLGSIFRGSGLKSVLAKVIMKRLYRLAFFHSKKVFFQNKDDRNEMIQQISLDINKTVLINGSGVNIERFKLVQVPQTPAFLYIGRLIRDKGVVEYLNACQLVKAEYPNIRCLLIGPFDSNPSALKPEELQPYIDKEIIEYYGEQSDVRPYIAQCSVYVLPSYHEGTPKTVLEAMAMGRAIITSDAPGCRETVIDGVNGFLTPIKNVDQIANRMKFLINNIDVCKKMGDKSREIACEKYDVNFVNQSIIDAMNL